MGREIRKYSLAHAKAVQSVMMNMDVTRVVSRSLDIVVWDIEDNNSWRDRGESKWDESTWDEMCRMYVMGENETVKVDVRRITVAANEIKYCHGEREYVLATFDCGINTSVFGKKDTLLWLKLNTELLLSSN